jgi:hypothetical protein
MTSRRISPACDASPKKFDVPLGILTHISPVIGQRATEPGANDAEFLLKGVALDTPNAFIDIAFTNSFKYERKNHIDLKSQIGLIISLLQLGRYLECTQTIGNTCKEKLEDILKLDRQVVTSDIISQMFAPEEEDTTCHAMVAAALVQEYVTCVVKVSLGEDAVLRFKHELDTNIRFANILLLIAIPVLVTMRLRGDQRLCTDAFDLHTFEVLPPRQ